MKKTIWNLFIVLFFFLYCAQVNAQEIQGTYAIKNLDSGKLLRPINASKKDGAPIVLYNPTNWKCMTWDFQHVSDNSYRLKNLFSVKTFQPDGDMLQQQPLNNNSDDQVWEFIETDSNEYFIKLKNSDLYLTSPADGKTNSRVRLEKKQGEGNRQLWTIYEQNPSI